MAAQYSTTSLGSRAFSHAKTYDVTRPGYPRVAIETLLNKLGVSPSDHPTTDRETVVLELGAGSGKFTKEMEEYLKGSPVRTVASDPSDHMCQAFRNNLPGIEIHQFPAQKIDLPDQSVNVVVAANALHWFADSMESFDEIHRVLVPGGMFGIIWMYPDFKGCPWIAEITDYLNPMYEQNSSMFFPLHIPYFISKVKQSEKFDEVDDTMFVVNVECDANSAYTAFASSSVLLAADDNTKSKFKQFFDTLIDKHFTSIGNKLTYMNRVVPVFWWKKKHVAVT